MTGPPMRFRHIPDRLGPRDVRDLYLTWLQDQGREPVVPPALEDYLDWWWDQLRPAGGIPWQMTPRQLREWWVVWCHRTERMYDLVPFDLTRFLGWWAGVVTNAGRAH